MLECTHSVGIRREIRRRANVVGSFPDGHSALMLASAGLRYVAGTRWGLGHDPAGGNGCDQGLTGRQLGGLPHGAGSGMRCIPCQEDSPKSETLLTLPQGVVEPPIHLEWP